MTSASDVLYPGPFVTRRVLHEPLPSEAEQQRLELTPYLNADAHKAFQDKDGYQWVPTLTIYESGSLEVDQNGEAFVSFQIQLDNYERIKLADYCCCSACSGQGDTCACCNGCLRYPGGRQMQAVTLKSIERMKGSDPVDEADW